MQHITVGRTEFLNVNMSFEMLRKKGYSDIASTYDLFLLKPFINKAYVIPIAEAQLEKIMLSDFAARFRVSVP